MFFGHERIPERVVLEAVTGNLVSLEHALLHDYQLSGQVQVVSLPYYEQAVVAFDQARNVGNGLPWRMTWYQFGMYEAYNAVGNYQETINLAQRTLNDGGGQYVEETFYYAGIAREGLGETSRAIENYRAVLSFNPNFASARARLNALTTGG